MKPGPAGRLGTVLAASTAVTVVASSCTAWRSLRPSPPKPRPSTTLPVVADVEIQWGPLAPRARHMLAALQARGTGMGLAEEPFRHNGGNFIDRRWCPPQAVADCRRGERVPGSASMTALVYPQKPRAAEGLAVHYDEDAANGWSAAITYGEQLPTSTARTVDFKVEFRVRRDGLTPGPGPDNGASPGLVLADTLGYTAALPAGSPTRQGAVEAVGQVELPASRPPVDQARVMTASAESMTAHYLARMADLRAAWERDLGNGRIKVCTVGPDRGSLPPECPHRAPTPDEEAKLRAAFDRWSTERTALVRDHGPEIHAAITADFDWPTALS